MAFKKKVFNDIFGTVLVLSALLSTASAVDCHGKSFHCVNSTHFMICVDLGGGVSQSIDNYLIPCPPPTVCQGTNHFECEFPAPTTPSAILSNVISETTLPWEEVVVTTNSPPRRTTKEYSEKYLNTESIMTIAENTFTTDSTADYTTEITSPINDIIVAETVPTVTESILYDTINGLEHVTETIITENIATDAAEIITETLFVEERNNKNDKSVNQTSTDTLSIGSPATEQAITDTVYGSGASDVSSNLVTETGNFTIVTKTRNVTRSNVLKQVTLTPDSLNTESSFEIQTAIDDILTTDKDLITTDIPVVTEPTLYDTTVLEQIMQTIPENMMSAAESINQTTTETISLGSSTTQQAIIYIINSSVSSDVSINLAKETRNATIVSETQNVTTPIAIEQVTSAPDLLNTESSFRIRTTIDDTLTTDKDLTTTYTPVVTESVLYETTAAEQIMQTIPGKIVTDATESITETPFVEQKNYTNDKSVNQINADKNNLKAPTTEQAIIDTVHDSVFTDVSSNLKTETKNAKITSEIRNITNPSVFEQMTSTPDSLNTETKFGHEAALNNMLSTDKVLLTTDISVTRSIPIVTVVTESTIYDTTTALEVTQTIPETIETSAATSPTENKLVKSINDSIDMSANQTTTENISLGPPTTQQAIIDIINSSVSSDVSVNLAKETRNATIVSETQNVTTPMAIEQVTSAPDLLNTESSFRIRTTIDDTLTTDKDLTTTYTPVVTESVLYETTAAEQIMQTIPGKIVTDATESITETPFVEQKNYTNDKSVNQINADKNNLEAPTTEQAIIDTVHDSGFTDVSSNLKTETKNAAIINETRNITNSSVLEQLDSTPDSLNTETKFGHKAAFNNMLTTDKVLLTTDISVTRSKPIVTESTIYDTTTALEKVTQTIPETIETGAATSPTENKLVKSINDSNDMSVNQTTTENISLGPPTTQQAIIDIINSSVSSDVSVNLAKETRNATIVSETQNVTTPIAIEQVTSAPDLLNTESSFRIRTTIDDTLTTDKDLTTTYTPVVMESILYETTAAEQIMQTIPGKIVTGATESITETPFVEQKNYTNDKSVNQINADKNNLEAPTTQQAIIDTVHDSGFTDVSSNLKTETKYAAIINETRNITNSSVLEQLDSTPDSLNTETKFGHEAAFNNRLTTDKVLLTTDISVTRSKHIVTESTIYDTTTALEVTQTIPETIETSAATSPTENKLVKSINDSIDMSANQTTTENISLGPPTTQQAIIDIINSSVSSDVSVNLAKETRNATIVSETQNVTTPIAIEQVTSAPDLLNTESSFRIRTTIDDTLTTDKDLTTTYTPVVTESVLYETTAAEQIMQTIPGKIVTDATESITETPFVEQKNYTNDKSVNQINADKNNLEAPTTEQAIIDTVHDSGFTDVSSNLKTETKNAAIINETRNITNSSVLEQLDSTPDSLNTETKFGHKAAFNNMLTTDKVLLTTDISVTRSKPIVTESTIYDTTTALEKVTQTIPETIETGAATSPTENKLVKSINDSNDMSVNQTTTENISLGPPTTQQAIIDIINSSVSSDVSVNLAKETRNATIVSETQNVTTPIAIEQVTSAPDLLNTESSFRIRTTIDDTLTTVQDIVTTDVIVTDTISTETESTVSKQIMQTIPENITTTEKLLVKEKKDLNNKSVDQRPTDDISLGSPATEPAIGAKLDGTIPSNVSINLATETGNAAIEDEIRNVVTLNNILRQATSTPESLIGKTSTSTEFPMVIDNILTRDNNLPIDVQNSAKKNMADATTTQSIKDEKSVSTEQKIILKTNVTIHPHISMTTEQRLETESDQLPPITATILTHDSFTPQYVKVEMVQTTIKPIVETSIEIDQPLEENFKEDFPKEVHDIFPTHAPLVLATYTNTLNKDATDQVLSKWTDDINTSVIKANTIVNNFTASVKQDLLTESTIAFTINKKELPTKEVVSTPVKSIVKTNNGTDLPKTTIIKPSLPIAAFDRPTEKIAIDRRDNLTSVRTEQPITTEFKETVTDNGTILTSTSAYKTNEKGTTEKYTEIMVTPTIPINDEIRGIKMMTAEKLSEDIITHSERPIRVVSDFTTLVESSDINRNNYAAVVADIQMTTLGVTKEPKNTYRQTTIAPSSFITTQAASVEGFKKENNFNQINKASSITFETLNDVDTKQKGSIINSLLDQATINIQFENTVLKEQTTENSIKVTETMFYQKETTDTYNIVNKMNTEFENQISGTTLMVDNASTDQFQQAVENANNIISNPLANQFGQVSKPNKASVDEHGNNVSTIYKTALDSVKNLNSESSVNSYGPSDVKIDEKITSQGYIVFTRANITVPSKVTETLSPFVIQLKTPEASESSLPYKPIKSDISPYTDNYSETKELEIFTEAGKVIKKTKVLAVPLLANHNKVATTDTNKPTSDVTDTDESIVLPSNTQLYETDANRISLNTKLHVTPNTAISGSTYLENIFMTVTNMKNVSQSSGIVVNTSSLTHDYKNDGSLRSGLKSEEKLITHMTAGGIQKQQTIQTIIHSDVSIIQAKNSKANSNESQNNESIAASKVSFGSKSTNVTESINVSERINIDAKTSFGNDTNTTTNTKGEIGRESQHTITTEHIINPVVSTTQALTKRIHPRPVSSVAENPRKQVPQNPTLGYSCTNGIRGRYSDKDDCRKFYICIGNNQPIIGTCPVNTVFSDIKKLCTKHLSHCIRENQFKCPSAGRFSDFINDNVYYICVSHKDHFYRFKFQCQKGFTLDKTTIRCTENKEIESIELISISSSDQIDDGSSKISSSTASNSSSISSSSSGSSGSSSGDSDGSSSNSRSKNKKTSEKKETKKDPQDEDDDDEVFECEKAGKFPIRNDCRRYYLCKIIKKSQYRRKIKKCDSGEVFHKSKKKCVDAESYEC